MRKRIQRSSMTARYTALFFAVITILAAGIAFVLMRFTAERFQAYELQTVETGMHLVANDLENQYEVMTDIVSRVQVTSYYKPAILKQNAYRDIELLENFVNFKNFSPLLDQYFLLYPNQEELVQKVFTSDGMTSYFPFYVSKLGVSAAEAEALFEQISSVCTHTCMVLNQRLLLIFPIRFVTAESASSSAVMCFVIPLSHLMERMQQMAANLPEHVALQLRDTLITGGENAQTLLSEPGIFQGDDGHHRICVQSEQGLIRMAAAVDQDKWTLLFSAVSRWMVAGIALCLLTVSMIAVGLAHVIVRPLRHLIEQHMPAGERFKNEFAQLEELVCRMERENDSSMQLLRDRLLLTILRGYYSESLLDRWGILHLSFDKKLYCVLAIDTSHLSSGETTSCAAAVEALSAEAIRLFAVHVQDDETLAVIMGYDTPEDGEQVLGRIQRLAAEYRAECFVGKACDAPQRLSISYMEAMTAQLRARKWQNEDLSDMHTFAAQLVAAAERADEEGMRQLCHQLMQQTDGDSAPRILLNNMVAKLTTELGILAGERRVMLDRQRLSTLMLLPSMKLFLRDVCELVRETFYREPEEHVSRVDETAQSIVEYVRENAFDADFDLSRIADCFGLSNDYVSMMIKKVTGSAFKEYLTDLRMEQACMLLRQRQDMTVNDVSNTVGYRKASNFIKKFKEKYGCTPAQYR